MEEVFEEGVWLGNRNTKETKHKICYMKRNLNLSVELETYQEIKRTIPEGKVSPLVDNLLKEYFKKKNIITLSSKINEMQAEDKVWEGSIEDGIDE